MAAIEPARRGSSPAWLSGLAGLLVFCLLLEALPRSGVVSSTYFPPVSTIAVTLWHEVNGAKFWTALGHTLESWAIGLTISVVAGIVVGLLIGSSGRLMALTRSTIEFLRPIPSVALIPLVILLLGSSLASDLVLVVYASFWQVLIQVLYGVRDVDPLALETARSYRLGAWSRVRYVIWPTTLPFVMTGVRLAASVALILSITAELIVGTPGLGKEIFLAQSAGAVPEMYAYVLVSGIIGVVVNIFARALERLVMPWHTSVRLEVAG